MKTKQRVPEQIGRVDWFVFVGLTLVLGATYHAIQGAAAIVKDTFQPVPDDPNMPGSAHPEAPAELQVAPGSWALLTGLLLALGAVFRVGRALGDIVKGNA
ncbi:hypothetical protein ACIF85_32735 [Streptomyces sp. NPDC086033]|uniref:hypothetical protein n=1 Tax=Streptomyces sp. NPDC086033 TaxID=3365747 RepID=UPI0037CE16E0